MNSKFARAFCVLFVLVGLVMLVGCGPDRPATTKVSGRVTYQGKPVVTGQIMFIPAHGRPAIASIGEDGSYTLTTFDKGDGAAIGKYSVTINATRTIGGPTATSLEEEGRMPSEPPRVERLVPEKYSQRQTSPLKAEVKEGDNVINFDLE